MFHSLKKLLLCIAILPLVASCNNPQDKEEKYMARGDALFAQEDYVRAKLEYKNAARISPTNPKIIYSLGLVEEAQGNITQALKAFLITEQQDENYAPAISKLIQYFMAAQQYEEVTKRIDHLLSIDPENATAHAIKGSLFLRNKEFDKAGAQIQKALEIDPANIIAYSVMAGIHNAQKAPEKALEILDEGIQHNPKDVSLRLLKAAIHGEKNNVSEIADIYHELFKLYPQETKFRFDLATIYSETGNITEAEKELREIVKLFPDNLSAKHRLAVFLEKNKDIKAAEEEIKSYINKHPENKVPYIWLADLYIRNDEDLLAVETLKNLIKSNPEEQISMNASNSLADIELRKGDIEAAQKLIESVLEKDVNNREALFIRANLSFYQGDNQKAVSDLRTITRDDERATKAHRVLAEIFLIQGHADLAIDTLADSLKSGAADLSNHVRLAQLLSLHGETKRAVELLESVTKKDPNYAIGWENAARLAIEMGAWDEAEQAIKQLEKLDGQKPLATFLRGQILDKTGKQDQAVKVYKTVVSENPSSPLSEHAISALLGMSRENSDVRDVKDFLSGLQTDSPSVAAITGGLLVSLDEKEEAETYFIKAINNAPKTQAPYITYARLLIEKNKINDALDILVTAEKAVPYEIAASLEKANILSRLSRTNEAIAVYVDLYKKNDQSDIIANNMAQMIADYQSDDRQAMEMARIAAERFANSDNPYHLDTLGWVYFRLGLTAQAQNVLKRAISLTPSPLHPQISYHYGALLAKTGQSEEAVRYLTQAISDKHTPYPGIEDAKALLNNI